MAPCSVAGELGDQAAGFDLGELTGVADQHENGAAAGGVGRGLTCHRVEPVVAVDRAKRREHDHGTSVIVAGASPSPFDHARGRVVVLVRVFEEKHGRQPVAHDSCGTGCARE
jgi:hypothetical protein